MGKYLVTPLTRLTSAGHFMASVSIRRGMHDRVFRFVPRFASDLIAMQYARFVGRSMALNGNLN